MELILTTVGVPAATASTISGIASGIFALGSIVSGVASNNQEAGAEIAASQANAEIARSNAAISESQTTAAVEKQRRQARLRAGENTAAAGASGLGVGSRLDILADNAAQEELDILTIKYQGELEKNSYLQEATLDEASARAKKKGLPARNAATVLGGVSKNFGSGSVI